MSHHHLHHQTVWNIATRQAVLECSHRHSHQSLSIGPSWRANQPSPGSLRFVEIQSMRWFTDKWMGWVLVPPLSVRIYLKMLVPLIPNAHLRMVPWPPKKNDPTKSAWENLQSICCAHSCSQKEDISCDHLVSRPGTGAPEDGHCSPLPRPQLRYIGPCINCWKVGPVNQLELGWNNSYK